MDALTAMSLIVFLLSVLTLLVLPLYALGLWLGYRIRGPRPVLQREVWGSTSVIIVVRNGEQLIAEKMRNSLDLDFPSSDWEIVVFSDGSTDRTAEIVRGFPAERVRLIESKEHQGKISGLNSAVASCTGEILVLTDADSLLDPDAVRMLSRNFADPEVGGVCGHISIAESVGLHEAQSDYLGLDVLIKRLETRTGTISSNSGKLYAMRRQLFRPIPQAVTDDLFVALSVIQQGFRFTFEPEARACVKLPSRTPAHEIIRRRRIVSTGLRGIYILRELLNPLVYGTFSLRLAINKIVRRLLPFSLISLLLSNVVLLSVHPLFQLSLVLQVGFYVLAISDPLLFARLPTVPLLHHAASLAFYFCVGSYGTLLGVLDFLAGRQIERWDPVKTDSRQPVTASAGGPEREPVLLVDLAKRFGGAEVRVLHSAQALDRSAASYCVAVLQGSPLHHRLETQGLQVVSFPYGRHDPRLLFSLRRLIHDRRCKAVDVHNVQSLFWGVLAARLSKVPVIATIHSSYRDTETGFKATAYEAVLRLSRGLVHRYIAVSDSVQGYLQRLGIVADRIALVPNGITLDRRETTGSSAPLRSTFGWGDDCFVITFVGRLEPVKGVDTLLEAFRQVRDQRPQVRCLIVGDGRSRSQLVAQADRLELQSAVRFLGFSENIEQLLGISDLFCLPSRSEAMPYALLEAAACRVPIVASEVGGIPALLTDNHNGLLTPPDDPAALATAILRIIDQPSLGNRLADAAYRLVAEELSIETMLRDTFRVYDETLQAAEA